MVAVPQAVDQFGNADRLVELGVAHRLDVDATPEALRAAVVALESSPEVSSRCAALRTELRKAGGACECRERCHVSDQRLPQGRP